MSKATIPPKLAIALWARAGGRCEYRGCNADLIGDLISGREDGKYGFIAHIVGDEPGGPRGDPLRSQALAKDRENLMLLCARHHKLIDVDALADHPEEVLKAMKAEHEDRIATVTGIDTDRASHVIRFAANIGSNEALVSTRAIFAAMPPDRHPADGRTIDLELTGSTFSDHEEAYWTVQRENLRPSNSAGCWGMWYRSLSISGIVSPQIGDGSPVSPRSHSRQESRAARPAIRLR
jgi:hypothetical protein